MKYFGGKKIKFYCVFVKSLTRRVKSGSQSAHQLNGYVTVHQVETL